MALDADQFLDTFLGPMRKPTRSEREDYARREARAPLRDYLDALDAQRRTLRLNLVGAELLRKGTNPTQRRRMARLHAETREQAASQMVAHRRRAFRRPVSVEIDLHAVGVEQPPASPPAVKAYLDALQGVVYADDRLVHHLRVTRHARDNPYFRSLPEDWLDGPWPRIPHGPADRVEVRVKVMPLRLYVADYDRVFRFRDQADRIGSLYDDREEEDGEFWQGGWEHVRDDDELSELRAEHDDDLNDRGVYSPEFAGIQGDLRGAFRRRRERRMAAMTRKLLLDQRPGTLDRPGPPSERDAWLFEGAPKLEEMARAEYLEPGRLLLPPKPEAATPEGTPSWAEQVRTNMRDHRAKWRLLDEPYDAPFALDISLRGAGEGRRDVDNFARPILEAFEEVFCSNRRGTVASYRAYVAEGGTPAIRVLVMPDQRLQGLDDARTAARWKRIQHGPREFDDRR